MKKKKHNKNFLNKIDKINEIIRKLILKKVVNNILNNYNFFINMKEKNRLRSNNLTKILLIKNKLYFILWNFILLILINPILSNKVLNKKRNLNSDLTIKLKVTNGEKLKIIDAQYIPDEIYINDIISSIDNNGFVKIINNGINNVIMRWEHKKYNLDKMFKNLNSLIEVDLSNLDTSGVTSMKAMFINCENLKYINFTNFNTSFVNNMTSMFEGCISLISIDLSSFDTSKVNYMDCMFKNCQSLISLNLNNFNTPNLRKMQEMFYGCSSLKV